MVDLQRTCEDVLGARVFEEVYIDNVLVIFRGKMQCGKRFTALPAALENYGFMVRIGFPI